MLDWRLVISPRRAMRDPSHPELSPCRAEFVGDCGPLAAERYGVGLLASLGPARGNAAFTGSFPPYFSAATELRKSTHVGWSEQLNTERGTTMMQRMMKRLATTVWVSASLVLLVLAAGCTAVRSTPLHPEAAGSLVPSVKDRDAGRVAAAYGFDVTRYQTIAIGNVSVDMPASWSEEDRRIASSVIAHLRSNLAQKLRTVDQLERVVDDASALDAAANALRLDVRVTALELDQLVATELWQWLGPGAMQMETRFVDAASGRVALVTADRRTARAVMTQARDIPGTTARLDEAANYLVMDLVNLLSRLEKTAAHA